MAPLRRITDAADGRSTDTAATPGSSTAAADSRSRQRRPLPTPAAGSLRAAGCLPCIFIIHQCGKRRKTERSEQWPEHPCPGQPGAAHPDPVPHGGPQHTHTQHTHTHTAQHTRSTHSSNSISSRASCA